MDLKGLQTFLGRRIARPLDIRLNDNLNSMVTVTRPRGKPARVSVHRMFLDAPRDVLVALVDFVRGPTPESRGIIRRFICANQTQVRTAPVSKPTLRLQPVGKYFDLQRIADQLNRTYFRNRLKFDITWSRRPDKPPRFLHHIQLGNYNERLGLIRIHPILDSPIVPKYYLTYIVYHEMAHVITPPEVDERGRVCHHTKKFYALERKFPEYDRAVRWQSKRLDDLVSFYCSRPKRRTYRQLTLF